VSDLRDLEATLQKIKDGKTTPFYVCFGDQEFLVKQAYDRLCETLVPESVRAFNFEQMDGNRVEPGALLDALQTVPMMPGPKVLAVPDCRFLLSISQGPALLAKSKDRWLQGDVNAGLRLLAKVLVLVERTWSDSEGMSPADWKAALGGREFDESVIDGNWLGQAMAQGKAADFPLPKGGDESQELLAGLEAWLASAPKDTYLVLAAPSADGRKKLFKFLESQGTVLDFKTAERGPQAGQSAATFLQQFLAQRSLSMDSGAAQRALSAYGHDLGFLAREVEKMEAHAHPRTRLSVADLEAVGSPRPEEAIFELLAAVGRKRPEEVLPLLAEQLKSNPPQMIFAMLAKEVRLLFLCRCLLDEGLIPGRLPDYPSFRSSVHPKLIAGLPKGLGDSFKKTHAFAAYQALNRCRAFGLSELKEALAFLHQAELQVKAWGRDVEPLLEELCLRLCGLREEKIV
jgi:DNA polymerase III delta subunit